MNIFNNINSEDCFFVVVGLDIEYMQYWVMNTDPVVWSSDISKAKKYLTFSDAEFDIKQNIGTFKLAFDTTKLDKIVICKLDQKMNVLESYLVLKKEAR